MALESGIQRNILDWFKTVRYAMALNIPGTEFAPGIPDILVCYKGLWLAFEVKQADGSLRPGQKISIRKIRKADGIAEAVRSLKHVQRIIADIDAGTYEPGVF